MKYHLFVMQILNWLLSDFSVFGVRIQYWMPALIIVFVVVLFFSLLDQRRFNKRNKRGS
jgi:uncharacterized membrane protein